jgi:FdhD protein
MARSVLADPGGVGTTQAGVLSLQVQRWHGGSARTVIADVADEVPIALEYNGVSHAVMLATPSDLEDFALGFSLSEGLVDSTAEVYDIEAHLEAQGITMAVDVASAAFMRLKARRRTLAGRTGCGICGTESLEQVLRPLPDLAAIPARITAAALERTYHGLADAQPRQHATGATHGAFWCTPQGVIALAREDVGRHNALDKLIGALAVRPIDCRAGFAFVTSRASVEMVQKAAMLRIPILAAVSAPTAMGVRVAEECGMTLIGFARGADFSVYTHADRITG